MCFQIQVILTITYLSLGYALLAGYKRSESISGSGLLRLRSAPFLRHFVSGRLIRVSDKLTYRENDHFPSADLTA